MKKITLVLLLLPFISCQLPNEKSREETMLEQRKAKVQAAYDTCLSYQLAWTTAQLNLNYWISHHEDSPEKRALARFISEEYPKMKSQIDSISTLCGDPDIKHVLKNMEKQAMAMKEIMESLSKFDDYENPTTVFLVQSRVYDADGDAVIGFRAIMNDLEILDSRLKAELQLKIKRD